MLLPFESYLSLIKVFYHILKIELNIREKFYISVDFYYK